MADNPDLPTRPQSCCCGETDATEVQLEEYRQLYGLALYRLNCLDSRTPLAMGLLTGTLGAIGFLPPTLQLPALLLFPLTLISWTRTTVGHARSLEDALRRIGELEDALNARFKAKLIEFQRSHPSANSVVGGRTGEESAVTAVVTSLILLFGCAMAFMALIQPGTTTSSIYALYLIAIAASMAVSFRRLLTYQYRKRPSDALWPQPPPAGSPKWPLDDERCP